MSFFFRHLTLMFVLLRGLSADDGVSLNCTRTVKVTYEEDLTLSCDIEWKQADCQYKNISVKWIHTTENLCEKNKCEKNKTSASLQMFNVIEEKNISVSISANCGTDSVSISLKIKPEFGVEPSIRAPEKNHQTTASTTVRSVREKVIPISLAAVSAVIIAVVGFGLYRNKSKQHQRVLEMEPV